MSELNTWVARLRAEVQMTLTLEAEPGADVATMAADQMRALLPRLPDGLTWVVYRIDLHREDPRT